MDETEKNRCMLEGAIGYAVYLIEQIDEGKVKTLEDVKKKLSSDGEQACGALSHHLKKQLKIAGFASAFIADVKPAGESLEKTD